MKKSFKIIIFVLGFLIFTACSKDSNQAAEPLTSIVNTIKKVTETTYSTTSFTTIIDFEYENGTLKRIISGTASLEYVYNGNKIVSINFYNNTVLQKTQTLSYSGDLLTIRQISATERTRFEYSGNYLSTANIETLMNNNWSTSNVEGFSFDNSGNQTERVFSVPFSSSGQIFKSSFVYDNKNNPFKMMNPYVRYLLDFQTLIEFSQNNAIQSYSYPDATSTTATLSENYEIVYNSNNYPTNIKCRRAINNELKSEITIEYN